MDARPVAGPPGGPRDPVGDGLDQQLQAGQPGLAVRRVGRSGYGREMGFEAIHEYTEPKSVWVNVDADPAVLPALT